MEQNENTATVENEQQKPAETKFCSECGKVINKKAVVCPFCGCQVEKVDNGNSNPQPQIVINNTNQNQNQNVNNVNGGAMGSPKNKWVAFFLCLFLGILGAHKFYEGKIGTGIIYLCTGGLFFIGVIIDLLNIIGKPNPYYV